MGAKQESSTSGNPFAWVKCGHPSMPTGPEECVTCLRAEVERLKAACEKLQASKESLVGSVYAEWEREVSSLELQVGVLRKALQDAVDGMKFRRDRGGPPDYDTIVDAEKALAGCLEKRKDEICPSWCDNPSHAKESQCTCGYAPSICKTHPGTSPS